jgi:hypothetical protein
MDKHCVLSIMVRDGAEHTNQMRTTGASYASMRRKEWVMKVRVFVGVVCMLAMLAANTFGQAGTPTVTVDENGNGNFNGTPLPFTLAPDPSPGGGASVLTYSLPFAGSPGDVLLLEPGSTGVLSDLIRFNGNGTLLFYSDVSAVDPADALADVGLPSEFSPVQLTIQELGPEGNNGAVYTPGPGQPGFDPAFLPSYNIVSDVPEPASFGLVGLGLLGIRLCCKRRGRQ